MAAEVRIEAERVEDLGVAGRVIVAVGFAEWDRPTVLLTDDEHAEDPFGRSPDGSFARRTAARRWPATVVRPDGVEVDIGALALTFPLVQAMPDGATLVVATRCREGDENARVFGPDGNVVRRWVVGDAVESAQTLRDGSTWVGWFDEGVVGTWCGPDHAPSGHGLARFDIDGTPTHRYDPPSGVGPIVDCYALNAAEDATWACPYPDFPLVRVRPDGATRAWRDGVGGARALAVHGGRILFFGGDGERRHDAHLARLGGVAVEGRRRVRIVDDRGRRLAPDRVEGRGRHLHLLCGTTWWRVDLATVPA